MAESAPLITVAALFVDPRRGGAYVGQPGVELWGARRCPERPEDLRPGERDARLYAGPHPVVAHPPCGRWCRLAAMVQALYPQHRKGEDGGCFEAALAAVRRWGGVLEHPAYSDAWPAHDLNPPPTGGGWVNADFVGGWTCSVNQGEYDHPAKKATWLYVCGAPKLPSLRWGHVADQDSKAWVSWCGNHTTEARMAKRAMVSRLFREEPRPGSPGDKRPRLGKRAAAATPPAFRDVLLAIARCCRPAAAATAPRAS